MSDNGNDNSESKLTASEWYQLHQTAIDEMVQWSTNGGPAAIEVELALVESIPTEVFENGDMCLGMVIGLVAAARTVLREDFTAGYMHCPLPEDQCNTPHPVADSNTVARYVVEVAKGMIDLSHFHTVQDHDGLA
jgi:hypothetical protein